jgi:hypothetical protein
MVNRALIGNRCTRSRALQTNRRRLSPLSPRQAPPWYRPVSTRVPPWSHHRRPWTRLVRAQRDRDRAGSRAKRPADPEAHAVVPIADGDHAAVGGAQAHRIVDPGPAPQDPAIWISAFCPCTAICGRRSTIGARGPRPIPRHCRACRKARRHSAETVPPEPFGTTCPVPRSCRRSTGPCRSWRIRGSPYHPRDKMDGVHRRW